MKILLIHGIHNKEGNSNVAALVPHLKKLIPDADVEVFSYGFMSFWAARWTNHSVAKQFADKIKIAKKEGHKVAVVSHSNGGAITYLATTRHVANPDIVIQINPALDNDLTPVVKWVEVIHSDQDRAVDFAQWVPLHIWGNQGKVGYKGDATNTINHNASKFEGKMRYEGHMGLFEPSRIEHWAAFIAHRIEAFTKGDTFV